MDREVCFCFRKYFFNNRLTVFANDIIIYADKAKAVVDLDNKHMIRRRHKAESIK